MVLVFLVFKDEQERQFMREKGMAAVETTKKLSRTWLQSCCAWMSCWFTTWMSPRVSTISNSAKQKIVGHGR